MSASARWAAPAPAIAEAKHRVSPTTEPLPPALVARNDFSDPSTSTTICDSIAWRRRAEQATWAMEVAFTHGRKQADILLAPSCVGQQKTSSRLDPNAWWYVWNAEQRELRIVSNKALWQSYSRYRYRLPVHTASHPCPSATCHTSCKTKSRGARGYR